MWSSISSPIRALREPRAAARRCRMSAQCASSSMACRADSNWPISFLVRETRSSFSWDKCDILVDYPRGVWYQENAASRERCPANGILRNRESIEGAMKLQFIHKTSSALKASSLYCQWVTTRQGEGG